MNILLGMLFLAPFQTGLPCIEVSGKPIELWGVTAQHQRPYRAETSVLGAHGAEHLGPGIAETNGDREDLLFYVSSHALAVGDLSEALWMPWLELRTFADQRRGVSSEARQATHLSLGGANNTCGLFVTPKDARGQRLESFHERSVMSSSRREQLTFVNKR